MTKARREAVSTQDPHPEEDALRELVATTVGAVHPLAIILFGSRARGDHRPTSDADLLIVMPEGTNTRRSAAAVDDLLTFAPLDVDIVAATPSRLSAARGDYGSVLHWAQEQGVTLYRADRSGAEDATPRSSRPRTPAAP